MNQDEQKRAVAHAALKFALPYFDAGAILGIGTGSTVDQFVAALAPHAARIAGAVPSSERTARALTGAGIRIVDLNDVAAVPIYVDGCDEIDGCLCMIKGGGAALTQEKIVAAVATTFVCIADESKRVDVLGRFPLPVEVIPLARAYVARELAALGGRAVWRPNVVTDNGNAILDVHGLHIVEPIMLEARINQIVGVVTNGLFAARGADVLLLATGNGVIESRRTLEPS